MAKKSKILRKILAGSKNVRFREFLSLLEAFGFELERINGSHHLVSHPKATPCGLTAKVLWARNPFIYLFCSGPIPLVSG